MGRLSGASRRRAAAGLRLTPVIRPSTCTGREQTCSRAILQKYMKFKTWILCGFMIQPQTTTPTQILFLRAKELLWIYIKLKATIHTNPLWWRKLDFPGRCWDTKRWMARPQFGITILFPTSCQNIMVTPSGPAALELWGYNMDIGWLVILLCYICIHVEMWGTAVQT